MAKDAPLAIEMPADRPAWVKVGVIAAVGFVIGIAWPRVMGVRLGPAAPQDTPAASGSHASAGRAPDAPPASVVKAAGSAVASAPPPAASSAPPAAAASAPPSITIGKGAVITCKTEGGETKKGNKDCGAVPGIDALVQPRVKKVATCAGALGQTGKLSLVVNADFASGRFWYDVGKSSTLQNIDAVTACLKTSFHGTSTTATPHDHPRYTVAYNATFGAAEPEDKAEAKHDKGSDKKSDKAKEAKDEKPSSSSSNEKEDAPAAPTAGNGEALVAWEVALVRDAPKTGGLVTRLPRGSKVKVGSTKDGWYLIKYGDNFANEGWVYRGAIGR